MRSTVIGKVRWESIYYPIATASGQSNAKRQFGIELDGIKNNQGSDADTEVSMNRHIECLNALR